MQNYNLYDSEAALEDNLIAHHATQEAEMEIDLPDVESCLEAIQDLQKLSLEGNEAEFRDGVTKRILGHLGALEGVHPTEQQSWPAVDYSSACSGMERHERLNILSFERREEFDVLHDDDRASYSIPIDKEELARLIDTQLQMEDIRTIITDKSDSVVQEGASARPQAEPRYRKARPSLSCPLSYPWAPTTTSPKPSPSTSPAKRTGKPKPASAWFDSAIQEGAVDGPVTEPR